MKTLKGIALLFGFCAIGAGMFLFVVFGMLFLALRDGFFAVVGGISRRLRGESKRRNEPKVFYGGRDGVPNLVMDADGFVEPPLASAFSSPSSSPSSGRQHVGHLIPAGSQLHCYKSGQPWRHGAAVGVMQDGAMRILQFPVSAVERQRLIDSRQKPVDHGTLGGDTVVFIHGQAGKKS